MNNIQDKLLTLKGIYFYHKFLKYSEYSPLKKIELQKKNLLSRLLKHCHLNIPWYSIQFKEYGVDFKSNDPFYELSKLPILDKKTVRENHWQFCAPRVADQGLPFYTSGTTGEPLKIYTSPNQWVVEQGIIWRSWKNAGYKFRDKIAVFRSFSPRNNDSIIKIDNLRNWTYFPVYKMDSDSIAEYLNFLKIWKPKYLRGYPSALNVIARFAIREGFKLEGLKGVFTASEALTQECRDNVKQAFDVNIFDHYGQAEITCMFHDCEVHSGMHLDWEYGHVELVPINNQVDRYEMIATNLHNFAMPLLRYNTGDVVEGGWSTCSCGRTTPIISKICGRSDDYLISNDGAEISSVNLYTYFSKISKIQRFQVQQFMPGHLIVLVSLWSESPADSDWLKNKIRHELEGMSGFRVDVKLSDDFMQTGEGKFPVFVNKIKR